MRYATISATGLYAPEKIVDNRYFSELYKKDMDGFLRDQRNIYTRHFMSEDQATSDLVVEAAKKALANAKLKPDDLDLIIVATDTPDYVSPSTASVVQYKLGANRAGTFDLNTACAGFVTATEVAQKFIVADERYRHILVVGAYGMSKFFNWEDFKVTSVFADGAGAAIVSATEDSENRILSSLLSTDGQYHDYMGIYAGGTFQPITSAALEKKQHQLNFAKRIPPEMNAEVWPRLTKVLLDRCGARLEDVAHFFFTQININSIVETMKNLNLPMSKAHNIMDRYGYTGSACIPMAVDDAATAHKLRKGDLIVLLGSGGGMSMAGMTMRWSYDT